MNPGLLNAKNLPFTERGAGNAWTGVNEQNVFKWIGKNYAARDSSEGGSDDFYKRLARWGSTPQAKGNDPKQVRLFNQAIRTGKVPKGLDVGTAMEAYDWAGRESGRFQQHKPKSLLSKLSGFIAPAIGFATGMPWLGAAVGAGIGGAKGGVLGGVLGGLGGYTAGMSGGLPGMMKPGGLLTFGKDIVNPSALGITGGNLGLNFASAPGAFAAAPVAGYGASGLGLTGANLGLNFASGALPGAAVTGYGASAVGGDPASLYTPDSLNPPKPIDVGKAARAAKAGLRLAGAIETPPQQPGLMSGPLPPGGQGIAAHSPLSMPISRLRYPGVGTNPFMARIV